MVADCNVSLNSYIHHKVKYALRGKLLKLLFEKVTRELLGSQTVLCKTLFRQGY